MQVITSKNTALNQVASTFTGKFNFDNCLILDYGCGKGLSKGYCETHYNNCKVFLYDPFHGFDETYEFCEGCANSEKNVITCNNVLNVLQDYILESAIKHIAVIANRHKCDVIFKIYEGDKTGIGRVTKNDCFQRNEKTESYIDLIKAIMNIGYHYDIKKTGQYIICKRLGKKD